jgi:acetylornithine deacetylase
MEKETDIAIKLLKQLIAETSFSKTEENAAAVFRNFLKENAIPFQTQLNNTWASNKFYDKSKPTILLNSHIDTVKPNPNWTLNPFEPKEIDGKIYGLGSNDAGGALVALSATFLYFYALDNLSFNLILLASAEEEISGKNGIESLSSLTDECEFAIIGEPTEMAAAVSERGLMVLDGKIIGKAGHAAREEGINAIYLAQKDIQFFETFEFEKTNPFLGKMKMSLTQINSGTHHNVVPSLCEYVVDIRMIPEYNFQETIDLIQPQINGTITARSMRLKPSILPSDHYFNSILSQVNIKSFGSSTLSDQALLNIASVKIGPGKSERSHTADEFIYKNEIGEGIAIYTKLLHQLNQYFEQKRAI